MERQNIIEEKSFAFAKEIVQLFSQLKGDAGRVIGKQLLRSGTSIGANVAEAIAGASRKDFIAKMTISLKEARESRYWLRLLKETDISSADYSTYLNQVSELIAILTSIIKSSRENS